MAAPFDAKSLALATFNHRQFLNDVLRTDASQENLSGLIVKLQLLANDTHDALDRGSEALIATVPRYGFRRMPARVPVNAGT